MSQNKTLKTLESILKTEILCVNLHNENGKLIYIITQKKLSLPIEFLLYKVEENNKYSFIAKGDNPNKLENKYVYVKDKKGTKEE